MKKINIQNIIEIAQTDDAWLIKRQGDNGNDYITTILKKDSDGTDTKEHISAIRELMTEILFEFLTERKKYAKNWLAIDQFERKDITEDFTEAKE